jgi:hypothetical protein
MEQKHTLLPYTKAVVYFDITCFHIGDAIHVKNMDSRTTFYALITDVTTNNLTVCYVGKSETTQATEYGPKIRMINVNDYASGKMVIRKVSFIPEGEN